MPDSPETLLENNRAWAERTERERPGFFASLAREQRPRFLWIGCSDSRVPASEIVGLPPGGLVVHRNVANLVQRADLNCLSVVEYSVRTLQVRHIIVCGHYGCGGVEAAMRGEPLGVLDDWLAGVRELQAKHRRTLDGLADAEAFEKLCELNVLHQLRGLCRIEAVRDQWTAGRPLSVHGWIYSLRDGRLRDLGAKVSGLADLEALDRQ